MIILLTGKPGVGKSTIFQNFVDQYKDPLYWVVTAGIPRLEGGRAGFEASNSLGETRIISHKTDIDSDVIIGENHVDVAAVDAMFSNAVDGIGKDNCLVLLDEIGPIQMLSPTFSTALNDFFAKDASSAGDLFATIHYSDQRLAGYRESDRALLITVTVENRDMMPAVLLLLAKHRSNIRVLSGTEKRVVGALLQKYVANSQLMQVQKLLQNAVFYAHDGDVRASSDNSWSVAGRHGNYEVALIHGTYSCTCDLFHGRNDYNGMPGECSHIQTVLINRGDRAGRHL